MITLSTTERINERRIKNRQCVDIVRTMMGAYNKNPKTRIIEKVQLEYFNTNQKLMGETLKNIFEAYTIMQNEEKTKRLIKKSFDAQCRVTNIVLSSMVCKQTDILDSTKQVHLKFFVVGDSQLCEECFYRLGGDENTVDVDSLPIDVNTYCTIEPNQAFIFSCSYICDYCFVNKLYKTV
ncbi:hypothetical protein [Phthorimaea operculella granulovirus]|uniref:Uncharacterized protein n=1 Tax=Phthorimaea operculella granulovirus TaxID=192584 RepID=Q8JRV2_9BBAC|nr:hypothetical protein [Phthorimaea operculella granulovirus]AAM70305.1 hypothetical protein [Phthorimaea operculella granulovirus]ANY57496.1 hypothetical protein PhopGVgp107 [Phthorimaea operculella granulovirus]QBH65942.1 hypothetical protein PhopGVgp107 [Phthorimaea operculella granulovirus]QBH66072.1 hypothetical protein PhopGVgp107 [Phthorimaea operculella granulovirus]QBH66202.1 hypothetical protein PhopGVgp107 [Phthorimaea operculella granulovirus]